MLFSSSKKVVKGIAFITSVWYHIKYRAEALLKKGEQCIERETKR